MVARLCTIVRSAIGRLRPSPVTWFMRAVHRRPAEAVQARPDLRVGAAIAMRFGTLKPTQEGVDHAARALTPAREPATSRPRPS